MFYFARIPLNGLLHDVGHKKKSQTKWNKQKEQYVTIPATGRGTEETILPIVDQQSQSHIKSTL